jgi:hypothetical protein
MLRNLQTNGNGASNGQNKASVDMVRGSFVTADEATKTLALATGIAGVKIVDRGTKLTVSVAQNFAISPYDADQDTILAGERGYLNDLEGRWATSMYDSTVNSVLAIGSYLTITAGKLVASPLNAVTIIKFLGLIPDNGHTLAGFEIDATVKLA